MIVRCVRLVVSAPVLPVDDADDMCPNCLTPWKCNGPHLAQGVPQNDQSGDAPTLSLEERFAVALAGRCEMSIGNFIVDSLNHSSLSVVRASDEDFVAALEREAFGR